MAGLLPGCGTLGDKIGHKRMLVVGLCLSGLTSLAAAYSPSPIALIGARALLAIALHMPIAKEDSFSSLKASRMIDSVAGIIEAAPTATVQSSWRRWSRPSASSA